MGIVLHSDSDIVFILILLIFHSSCIVSKIITTSILIIASLPHSFTSPSLSLSLEFTKSLSSRGLCMKNFTINDMGHLTWPQSSHMLMYIEQTIATYYKVKFCVVCPFHSIPVVNPFHEST